MKRGKQKKSKNLPLTLLTSAFLNYNFLKKSCQNCLETACSRTVITIEQVNILQFSFDFLKAKFLLLLFILQFNDLSPFAFLREVPHSYRPREKHKKIADISKQRFPYHDDSITSLRYAQRT